MSHDTGEVRAPDPEREFRTAFGSDAWIELTAWSALDKERRSVALLRLRALNLREGGSEGLTMTRLAKLAGMDRAHFHRLADRWAGARSIGTLVPYATRKPRGPGVDFEDDPGVRSRAEAMLLSGASESKVVAMIMATAKEAVSKPGARAWVRRRSAELDGDEDSLRSNYGKKLVIDVMATDLVSTATGKGEVMVTCLVVEPASREIVGAAVVPARQAARSLARAIGAAADALLAGVRTSASTPTGTVVSIVLPPMPDKVRQKVNKALSQRATVISDGERRFGRLALPLLGGTVAGLRLRPRQTHDRPEALEAPEVTDGGWRFVRNDRLAVAEVERAVAAHNERAVSKLEERLGPDLFASRRLEMATALVRLYKEMLKLQVFGVLPQDHLSSWLKDRST